MCLSGFFSYNELLLLLPIFASFFLCVRFASGLVEAVPPPPKPPGALLVEAEVLSLLPCARGPVSTLCEATPPVPEAGEEPLVLEFATAPPPGGRCRAICWAAPWTTPSLLSSS